MVVATSTAPSPLPPLRLALVIHGLIGTGFVLGALMIAMLYVVAISNYRLMQSGGFPGAEPQLAAFAGGSVLLAIPGLLLLLGLAWQLRFHAVAHKRLITAVSWSAAVPGLGRLLAWVEAPPSPLVGIAMLMLLLGPLRRVQMNED